MLSTLFWIFVGLCVAGYAYHRWTSKTVAVVDQAADLVNAEISKVKVYANGVSTITSVVQGNVAVTANTVVVATPSANT